MNKTDQFESVTVDDKIWKLIPLAKEEEKDCVHRSLFNRRECIRQIERSMVNELEIVYSSLPHLRLLEIRNRSLIDELPKQLTKLHNLRELQYEWGTPKLDYSLEKLSHQNQVKTLGYRHKDEWLMQKESLENQFLRKCPVNAEQLAWCSRIEIALAVAQGLSFLHNSEKKPIYEDFKASNILLFNGVTSHNTIEKVSTMDAADFTALDVSTVLSGKTGTEIKKSQLGYEDEAEKALKWWCQPSYLQNNWSNVKEKNESQSNVFTLLLLIATLLSTITFLTALKIRGCKLEVGYEYSSSLNPICQIVNQDPLIIRYVIAFNSVAFFLSIALMMILFNELPLRPLLLVSAFSMLGAYVFTIWGPLKPLLSSF